MSETKYLAILAEGDVDEDEGMTANELARVMAPEMARDAARYHIMMRIPAEQAVEDRFDALTLAIELVHGDDYLSAHYKEEMGKILDQLVAEFPETN